MIYNESVNVILVAILRPKRIDGDLLHQILSVLRSPDSSILDCVVPKSGSPKRSPEYVHRGRTYVDRVRTSIERVRRWQTYVDRTRAWIRTAPEDTYVGRTRTSENTYVHRRNM